MLEEAAAIRQHSALFLLHVNCHDLHERRKQTPFLHHGEVHGVVVQHQSLELGTSSTNRIRIRPVRAFFEEGQHAAVVLAVELH